MHIPVVADNDDFVPQRCALFRHLNFQKWSENSVCFIDFDFEMCFAPQLRALFEPLNFQKWSENGVFCTFLLSNMLRATTACTFSTSQLPNFFGNEVFWTFRLPNVLRAAAACNFWSLTSTRHFSDPTFRPSGATWCHKTLEKHSLSRLFYCTFSRTLTFSLLPFSSLTLPTSACPPVHIVGSLTSKLPSIIHTYIYIYVYTYIYIYIDIYTYI